MNEQRGLSTTAIKTSPLRDSSRNTSPSHIRHWSQPSTIPLRLTKHESPLTLNSSNPRYSRLPTQLARRQSSSYNHVKNNALVSNSPFKAGASVKVSRIPALSRKQSSREDENHPDPANYQRRQSKGLHVLAKEQVVTNSPFLSDKSIAESRPERSERGRSLTSTEPSTSTPSITSPAPPVLPTQNETKPETTYSPNIPLPITPRKSRTTGVTNMETSSPKSALVSPKRLRGPRSLSASPGAELKAQRRKTVTFVELIDVLEFDKDEISDIAYSSADEYGSPEPQSPVTTPNDQSFDLGESDIVNDQPTHRTPHISRDEVRRRLVEHRSDEYEEAESSFNQALSDASFTDTSFQNAQDHPVSTEVSTEIAGAPLMEPVLDHKMNFPLDVGDSTSELQDALDGLMLGVEEELMTVQRHRSESDLLVDYGEVAHDHLINLENSFDKCPHDVSGDSQISTTQIAASQSLESPESGSTDDDNDEPTTPRDQHSQLPHLSTENVNELNAENNSFSTLKENSFQSFMDNSNFTTSGLQITGAEIETSSPPRKDILSASCDLSSSLVLPPLSFDEPLQPSSSWDMELDIPPSNLPGQAFKDTRQPLSNVPCSTAPPVPPKDDSAIQRREELIKARRKELRQDNQRPVTYHEGRPNRRRSLSTGDAEDLGCDNRAFQKRAEISKDRQDPALLDVPLEQAESDRGLGEIIDNELKLRRKPTVKEQQARNKLYKLREREDMIYASAEDKVSHSKQAGDVDAGKAWRTVRRPSDMNEHSQLIKQYRAQQKPGKAYGKVFVRVLGIRNLNIPMPNQPTPFTCTLNNGIHFVTTPECRIGRDARIEQEFELIEHSKLEFKLTLKVCRTPEIEAQIKVNTTPSMPLPVTPPPPPVSSSRNVRSFFGVGNSPKKHNKALVVPSQPTPEPTIKENFARYLKPDGTLAQALVSFKEIAARCDTCIFETSFPLIGQRTTGYGKTISVTPWAVGEIVLKIFRLPPLPGIPNDQLPQSLDECHRGLQYTSWHKVTYHEGILTQIGGDCRTWRRRLLRVVGSNLVAFNDVTKKATATIDLKKAIAVEDNDMTSLSKVSSQARQARDEFDEVYMVERSFCLIFRDEEEIIFFADNDESKRTWLRVLEALIGHVPPNPLWAELAWQRQEEIRRQNGLVVKKTPPQVA